MDRCDNENTIPLPKPPTHDACTVVAVTNDYLGIALTELLHALAVVAISRGEVGAGKGMARIDAGVEFKPIVPALPVLTPSGHCSGYFVVVGSMVFADWQHRAVSEAKLCIVAQYGLQQLYHSR